MQNLERKKNMTRKDFQLIADVLKGHCDSPMNRCVIEQLALTFATELAKTNPNFNQQRFVQACMPLRTPDEIFKLGDLTAAEAANLR